MLGGGEVLLNLGVGIAKCVVEHLEAGVGGHVFLHGGVVEGLGVDRDGARHRTVGVLLLRLQPELDERPGGLDLRVVALEKAGLDPEAPPTTIEEMAACAEKLLIKDGETVKQYAITLGLQNCYLNNWIANQGDVYYLGNNEAGRTGRMTEVTFDKDGTMLTLLNEWQKVLDTGAVQSVDSGDQPKDEFISGLSAMFIGGNWAMTSIEEGAAETGFELGVCPMPKVRESDIGGSCPGGTSLYMIDKGSKDRTDAAWDFMKWWTSAETQARFCMKTKYIPVNAKALADQEIQTWLKENPQYSVAFDVLSQSDPRIQEQLAPTQQEFQTIFQDTCLQWANGELTAEQCVQIMAEKCNAALDEFNAANPVG